LEGGLYYNFPSAEAFFKKETQRNNEKGQGGTKERKGTRARRFDYDTV